MPISRRRTLAANAAIAACALVLAAPVTGVERRAFVTSVTGNGNLNSWPDSGGLSGLGAGDAICRTRAAAGGLANAASYVAWLSSPLTDAYCRVRGLTGKKASACGGGSPDPAGPWYLVSPPGAPITGTIDRLTGAEAEIYRGVLQDEFGTLFDPADGTRYWTGTLASGEAAAETCVGWAVPSPVQGGGVGDVLSSAVQWSYLGWVGCNSPRRLLCLESGASDPPVPLGVEPGLIAFVTSATGTGDLSSWPEAAGFSGLAAGDAICRTLASAARLPTPPSFVAWLSTSSIDARDRLLVPAVPIRRLDGYRLANSKADLLDGTNANSLHVDEQGRYVTAPLRVHTGTLADGTGGAGSCSDWDSTAGEVSTGVLAAQRSDRWTDDETLSCGGESRLYCVSNVVTLFWDGFDRTGDTSRWSAVAP